VITLMTLTVLFSKLLSFVVPHSMEEQKGQMT